MFPSEYEVLEHRRDLLRQAELRRLARIAVPAVPLVQRAGESLLRLGARLSQQNAGECYTIEFERAASDSLPSVNFLAWHVGEVANLTP